VVLYNIHIEAYLQEEREKLGSLETNPNTRDEKKDLQPAIRTNATGLSESYEDHSIIRFVNEPLIVAQDFFLKIVVQDVLSRDCSCCTGTKDRHLERTSFNIPL